MLEVRLVEVETYQLLPHLFCGNQAVLQHFCIARTDVLCIQSTKKFRVEDDIFGVVEDTNLILQSIEVDARLAAHRSIDHSEQGSRDVDEVDATLEGGSGEATEVGHHAAT